MNDTLTNILTRRSIRQYKQEQIKDEELQAILEAGKYAPTAMNQQLWHFTVVQNQQMLQKINQGCQRVFLNSGNKSMKDRAKVEDFSIFYKAPTLILVSVDEKAIAPHNDGSLALGTMFLAAHSLGIGSCWIHAVNALFSTEEGKFLCKELGIPESYISIGSGAFGYKAAEAPPRAPRKENLINIIK